jgi:hypothetical protein
MNAEDLPALGDRALAMVKLARPTTSAARQRLVAFRIIAGEPIVAIARDTGIAAATIYAWMSKREFREFVDNLRSAVINESMGRLVDASVRASDTLVGLLDSADESIRLRASTSPIDTLVKLREHLEYDRRIRALEERYGQEIGDGGLEGDDFDGVDGGDGQPAGPIGAAGAGAAEEAVD